MSKVPTKEELKTKNLTAKQQRFLEYYLETCKKTEASRRCGLSVTIAYSWEKKSKAFAEALEICQEIVAQKVDDEVYRRGVEGWDEKIYQKGVDVGVIHKYDSTLLIFLAKALRPEKYRERFETRLTGADDIVERLNAGRKRLAQAAHGEKQATA